MQANVSQARYRGWEGGRAQLLLRCCWQSCPLATAAAALGRTLLQWYAQRPLAAHKHKHLLLCWADSDPCLAWVRGRGNDGLCTPCCAVPAAPAVSCHCRCCCCCQVKDLSQCWARAAVHASGQQAAQAQPTAAGVAVCVLWRCCVGIAGCISPLWQAWHSRSCMMRC